MPGFGIRMKVQKEKYHLSNLTGHSLLSFIVIARR